MTRYLPLQQLVRPQPVDQDDELLIALDDDPELQPYLEAYDRLILEPPQYPASHAEGWAARLWRRALAERMANAHKV